MMYFMQFTENYIKYRFFETRLFDPITDRLNGFELPNVYKLFMYNNI